MVLLGIGADLEGNSMTTHECNTCHRIYTVTPAPHQSEIKDWDNCLDNNCASYDPKRDIEARRALEGE